MIVWEVPCESRALPGFKYQPQQGNLPGFFFEKPDYMVYTLAIRRVIDGVAAGGVV